MSWELSLELASLAADAPGCLPTDYDKPFASSGSLDNRVRQWVVKAGLVGEEGKADRFRRGIRKRRAEEIAEAGGTVTRSWRICRTAIRKPLQFTRKGQKRLAERADRRMEQASKIQGAPRLPWDICHNSDS